MSLAERVPLDTVLLSLKEKGQEGKEVDLKQDPPIAEVEDKLGTEAASLGADAIVAVVDRLQPVGAFVSGL
jgi:hypothetical protein